MYEHEMMTKDFSSQWLNRGDIVSFKVAAINPKMLEAWSGEVLDTLAKWPKQRPLGIMFDLSEHGVGIPYLSLTRGSIYNIAILRAEAPRVSEIMNNHPEFRVWFALVLSDSTLGSYMLSNGREPPTGLERIKHKVFFSSGAGIHWLTEALESSEQVTS